MTPRSWNKNEQMCLLHGFFTSVSWLQMLWTPGNEKILPDSGFWCLDLCPGQAGGLGIFPRMGRQGDDTRRDCPNKACCTDVVTPRVGGMCSCTGCWRNTALLPQPATSQGRGCGAAHYLSSVLFGEMGWEEQESPNHFVNSVHLNRRDWLDPGHVEFTEFVKLSLKFAGFRASPSTSGQVLTHQCLLREVHSVCFWSSCTEMIKVLCFWDLWSPERSFWSFVCLFLLLDEVGKPNHPK